MSTKQVRDEHPRLVERVLARSLMRLAGHLLCERDQSFAAHLLPQPDGAHELSPRERVVRTRRERRRRPGQHRLEDGMVRVVEVAGASQHTRRRVGEEEQLAQAGQQLLAFDAPQRRQLRVADVLQVACATDGAEVLEVAEYELRVDGGRRQVAAAEHLVESLERHVAAQEHDARLALPHVHVDGRQLAGKHESLAGTQRHDLAAGRVEQRQRAQQFDVTVVHAPRVHRVVEVSQDGVAVGDCQIGRRADLVHGVVQRLQHLLRPIKRRHQEARECRVAVPRHRASGRLAALH